MYSVFSGFVVALVVLFSTYSNVEFEFLGTIIVILGGISGGISGGIFKKMFQPDYMIGSTSGLVKAKIFWSVGVQPVGAIIGILISGVLIDIMGIWVGTLVILIVSAALIYFSFFYNTNNNSEHEELN
jgi:hypothetical protein